MDKALVRYIDNGSTRYNGKEYAESLSKLRREKSATGPLKAGETVTIKTKSHVWTAVVVNPRYEPPQKKRRRAIAPEKPKQSNRRSRVWRVRWQRFEQKSSPGWKGWNDASIRHSQLSPPSLLLPLSPLPPTSPLPPPSPLPLPTLLSLLPPPSLLYPTSPLSLPSGQP